ncbi:MAG: UvrD-helicase domain-containing protein, partial [Syntrophomonadaceae bacterium]|nr:UvrD-helicase domain-containing protein [Syntrophomonadaceae bacterium]
MAAKFTGTLNPSQRQAVQHGEGPLLVLAGAGSGKTRVLTYRVAYLIQEMGVSPSNILAITFTNKAAETMKQRLQTIIPGFRVFWVSTFHSAANRILRQEIQVLGYDPRYTIIDEDEQLALIKKGIRYFNWDEKVVSPRGVAARLGEAKNRLLTPEAYSLETRTPLDYKIAQLYRWYQQQLLEYNALDFDDLIMLTVQLFQQHPSILSYYQNKFRYILVDEYQDTNHAQYVLVNQLAACHRNLCVVGDPDQSIYGWRGANLHNILNFKKDYPEALEVKLEENYRSTKTILEAANQVIRHNRQRLPKLLWTSKDQGEPITVYSGETERDEGSYVAERIVEMHRQGRPYRSFAVFYRTHAQSRVLEEAMIRSNIPYRIIGGLRFYQRKEIKDIMAYLKLVNNPADNLSLQRVINVPSRGVGESTWKRLEVHAGRQGLSYYRAIPGLLSDPQLAAKSRRSLKNFYELIEELRELGDRFGITRLAEAILERSGYLKELEKENTIEAQSRIENLKEFLSLTSEYDQGGVEEAGEPGEEHGLNHFLAMVALVTDLDEYKEGDDAVTLMTVHAAKGLEFPVVIVTGLEENVFPHARTIFHPEEMEEERRLCYVALTRAQEKLFLTWAKRRTLSGRLSYNEVSRFLEEIPAELVEITDVKPLWSRVAMGLNPSAADHLPGLSADRPASLPAFVEPEGCSRSAQVREFAVG